MIWLVGVAAALLIAWFVLTQPWVGSIPPRGESDVSIDRLERHVRALSRELPPRAPDPRALDAAAAYIRERLQRHSHRVDDQPFEVDGRTFRNVIASFGPDAGRRVVVGAHYDTAGGLPGADDNASGVAGLIELARLLGHAPPPGRVELVAFTLEEPPYYRTPHMGSAVHAASLRAAGAKVAVMMSLEMIGYFDDRPGSQLYPSPILKPFYPDAGNFIAVVGNLGQMGVVRRVKRAMRGASPLPVYSLNGPGFIPGLEFSDHLNYWAQGFPAVMITDTAFYRNPTYHTAEDTPERLDYDRMAQVVSGVLAAIRDFTKP